jgi:catechol 2,3-dioxygenase-like lactoylglutathione lyase family enzyme
MTLSSSMVRATVAVSDTARARAFYEGRLGLAAEGGGPEEVTIYACGGGTVLQVYVSPEHAGASTATAASWSVDDFDATIDGLIAAGVTFARYDGRPADERGVHASGEHRVAWCADPDGNVLAIDNGQTGGM